MKLTFSILSLTLSSLLTAPAFAERSATSQAWVEGGTFTTLTVAGTVLGGPLGMVIGAAAGAWLAEETRNANQRDIALTDSATRAAQQEESLMHTEQQMAELQQDLVTKMTFQVLFATGEDTLNELDRQRVEKLAAFLQEHPRLNVTLDGHTDRRGTDEYNNVLSIERAKSVKSALLERGIDAARIQLKGHGSSYATAAAGDEAGFAKDRKVVIELGRDDLATAAVTER